MRKGLLYIMLLLGALVVPKERVELGKLRPVETLYVYRQEEQLCLQTDLGDTGIGMNVDAAVADLRESSAGVVFLDTAEYLIVESPEEKLIRELGRYVKQSVRLCEGVDRIDPSEATSYLSAHCPDTKLRDWEKGEKPDVLAIKDGSYSISKNISKFVKKGIDKQ